MRTILIYICIFFFVATSGIAKPIRLEDFDWGMTLLEVEAYAANKNFALTEKEITGLKPHLEYDTHLHGNECVITFFFTPRGQKLYSAIVAWDTSTYGSLIKSILMKEYKYPREEIPSAQLSIWTRTNTEVELRYGFENTTLTYSNLDLWNDFKEEKKLIEEREDGEE